MEDDVAVDDLANKADLANMYVANLHIHCFLFIFIISNYHSTNIHHT